MAAENQWPTNTPRALNGRFILGYYSSGGSGTGKLQYAGDGTNFVDVTDSDITGSGQLTVVLGSDEAGNAKWQVVLTGDTVCTLTPVRTI